MKNLIKHSLRICCSLSVICALAGSASAEIFVDTATFTFVVGDSTDGPGGGVFEWNQEHGDIGVAFEAGELELHYHFEDGLNGTGPEVEYEPGEVFVRVADNTSVTDDGLIPLVGGDTAFILPQSGTLADSLGVPFVGIASEELDPGFFSSLDIALTDFDGPGEFALWQDGLSPTVFMQTNNGLDATDNLPLGVGLHDHFNYGFSTAGTYQLTFTATAVPEPGSLAALSLGVVGLFTRRRRRS
ncbi:MAG: choice-of-anchor M domain-containing protein [Aureliella sp.]